jgi:hypothetical protein
VKTKRSMKVRKCGECKSEIAKGDLYGLRSERAGEVGVISHDGTVKLWQPYRIKFPVCAACAAD